MALQESYPQQLLAQKLNNRAAHCIEIGQFDVAVNSLVKALKISQEPRDDLTSTGTESYTCPCQYCSLDYCMTHSQQIPCQATQSITNDLDCKSDSVSGGGYIYRRPIRVAPQSIEEGHSMAVVLPLILTFNLALAHHLNAIESQCVDRSKLQRVLKLYELAYRWQIEEEDVQAESLRFTMVIANNLGEIHRLVSNREKHQKCLEHLLSTLMFMVDCHEIESNVMDMDGFLRNTAELILNSRCAGAA